MAASPHTTGDAHNVIVLDDSDSCPSIPNVNLATLNTDSVAAQVSQDEKLALLLCTQDELGSSPINRKRPHDSQSLSDDLVCVDGEFDEDFLNSIPFDCSEATDAQIYQDEELAKLFAQEEELLTNQSVHVSTADLLDPNPEIHALFREYNERIFESKLDAVAVKWSNRMTL